MKWSSKIENQNTNTHTHIEHDKRTYVELSCGKIKRRKKNAGGIPFQVVWLFILKIKPHSKTLNLTHWSITHHRDISLLWCHFLSFLFVFVTILLNNDLDCLFGQRNRIKFVVQMANEFGFFVSAHTKLVILHTCFHTLIYQFRLFYRFECSKSTRKLLNVSKIVCNLFYCLYNSLVSICTMQIGIN